MNPPSDSRWIGPMLPKPPLHLESSVNKHRWMRLPLQAEHPTALEPNCPDTCKAASSYRLSGVMQSTLVILNPTANVLLTKVNHGGF